MSKTRLCLDYRVRAIRDRKQVGERTSVGKSTAGGLKRSERLGMHKKQARYRCIA